MEIAVPQLVAKKKEGILSHIPQNSFGFDSSMSLKPKPLITVVNTSFLCHSGIQAVEGCIQSTTPLKIPTRNTEPVYLTNKEA